MFNWNSKGLTSKIHLSLKGNLTEEGSFDWSGALLDAAIISGITFFTGLGTLGASAAITANSLCFLLSAVGTEFLGILAAKRGLIQKSE